MDGCTLDTEGERERVVKCLEAAIRRRISEVRELVLQWCYLLLIKRIGSPKNSAIFLGR